MIAIGGCCISTCCHFLSKKSHPAVPATKVAGAYRGKRCAPYSPTTDTPWSASVRLTGAPTSSGKSTRGDTTKMASKALAKVYSMTLPS